MYKIKEIHYSVNPDEAPEIIELDGEYKTSEGAERAMIAFAMAHCAFLNGAGNEFGDFFRVEDYNEIFTYVGDPSLCPTMIVRYDHDPGEDENDCDVRIIVMGFEIIQVEKDRVNEV